MKSLRAFLVSLVFVAFLGFPERAEGQTMAGWNLVWADEFDQADGTAPDSANWDYDIGGGGWGNNEIQYYTNSTNNSRIEGGELIIEAREESFGGRDHTSARLKTKGRWDWTYGRFEARLKVPAGEGLWPACWMLGSNIDAVGWPFCGEIDIMEFVGREPKEVFGTIHGPGYSGGGSFGGTYTFGPDVSDDYHVFAVEWEPTVIRWYVDGLLYHTATPDDLGANPWVFDHGHFLLLNLAIGGNFGGPLDPLLTFPRQYKVDYVRVYEKEGVSDANVLRNPGLEDGVLVPWTGYSPGGVNAQGAYIEDTYDTYYNGGNPGGDKVLTHSGIQVAKVFGDFSGTENLNGFYQDTGAAPGSQWNARGWTLTHPQDLMSGANEAWIEVSFRDGGDTVLGLHRSTILTAATVVPGEWTEVVVDTELDPVTRVPVGGGEVLTAPPGTVTVRFEAVFRQPGSDGGAMYFDDLFLGLQPVALLPLDLSIAPATELSWSATNEGSSYQPQESSDGVAWTNIGEAVVGTTPASVFATTAAPFYRVVETLPPGLGNGVANASFETTETAAHPSPGAENWTIASPEDTDPSNGTASMLVLPAYGGFTPRTGDFMLVLDSATPPAPAVVNAPNTDVRSDFIAVSGDTSYDLSFHAAHVVKTGGANPQFVIRYYDAGFAYLGDSGFESFSSLGSAWTEVQETFTTPTGTAWLTISWIQALGAGNDWQWVTLIDDVAILVEGVAGGQNILPVTLAPAYVLFWETEEGFDYQLQSAELLPVFADVGSSVMGSGGRVFRGMPRNPGARFFRVERSP